jgi:hypothetical protein
MNDYPSLLEQLHAADSVLDDERQAPPADDEDDAPIFPDTYCGLANCAAHTQEPYYV